MRIAITGASGFIGRALAVRAVQEGHGVRAITRGAQIAFPPSVEVVEAGNLVANPLGPAALEDCDVLVNCAARVHVSREPSDPDAAYAAANSQLPVALLKTSAEARVARFVQLSSVAAVASRTAPGLIVDDSSPPEPQTAYGRSKLSGDRLLELAARDCEISLVCIRPPTVFGPGVSAHFRTLMRCAKFGVPLPIGAVDNRRSFMFLGNLVDALLCACRQTQVGSYIVTDSPPVSTAELYRGLLAQYGRRVPLPGFPAPLARFLGRILLGDRVESLIGNAAYDGSRFQDDFGWFPKVSLTEALALTVADS